MLFVCLLIYRQLIYISVSIIISKLQVMKPTYSSKQWQTPPQNQPTQLTTFSSQPRVSTQPSKSSQKIIKRKSISLYTLPILLIIRLKKSMKKRKHRQKILEEWYNTECTYNLDLNIAMKNIKKPMQQIKIIDNDQSQVLFPEIQGMIQLSNMMIQVISEARQIKNPNKIVVGREINRFVNGYKLYGGYFGSHCKSSKLLAELSKNNQDQMKNIEVNMQAQLVRKQSKKQTMTIKDCMQQPLYRLFKYVLLLKEYMKKLPKNHPDYQSIVSCHQSFHEINNFNNELMKKIQDQEKKVKLDKLFGQALKQNRFLVAEMQASTIYFDAKLYIFNDLVIIAKVQSLLGTQREEKYGNFELNQFCYVAEQDDLKYFKNILILISKEQCIHLFFPDEGTRAQLLKCMQKNLRELRIKQHQRRKVGDQQKINKGKKIMFTLQQKQQNNDTFLLQPQFRIEIVGLQVRPISTLSNDTVYVTRFMIPEYYQDELNFIEGEGLNQKLNADRKHSSRQSADSQHNPLQRYNSLPFNSNEMDENHNKNIRQNNRKALNHKVQIHFSVLEYIYKQMVRICPDRIPDIDPFTKDVNIYAKGKRKTKSFQMRKFLIQQFLNFIFRHPAIMSNPIWFLSKLRVNEDLWNYSTQRNSQMKKEFRESQKSFGYDHCSICKRGKINSVQQLEHYRGFYTSSPDHRTNKQSDRYCFNFFNLIRIRLLSFNYICFNTLQRILLFYHYLEGRIDYPFTMHRCKQKIARIIKINFPSIDDNFVSIVVDSNSVVGEVLEQLANMFKMKSSFDFDLMVNYNGKNRLLDRDQIIYDLIKLLNIEYEQCSADKKQVIKTSQNEKGLFDTLKSWKNQIFNKENQGNKIYFLKTTYLHRSLQLKSFQFNAQKRQLEVQRIFWAVKKGLIKLQQSQFAKICAYFYCLKQLDNIQHFSVAKMSTKTLEKITPPDYMVAINSSQSFRVLVSDLIEQQKNILLKNNKNSPQTHSKILELITLNNDYLSYYIEVEPKEMPEDILPKAQVAPLCLIGINHKGLIITRTNYDLVPLVTLKIQQFQYSLSVFSLFVTHENWNFRFDGKMLYHFGELIRKYQLIAKKFPQHNA